MLTRRTRIKATPDQVWDVVGDPDRWNEFWVGFTRWEPIDGAHGAVGDRYWIRMAAGSIEAGGRIRFTEVLPQHRLAWESEAGTEHKLALVIEPEGDHTNVRIEFELVLMGGLLARVAEQAGYRIVGQNFRATLHVLRHLVEHEA